MNLTNKEKALLLSYVTVEMHEQQKNDTWNMTNPMAEPVWVLYRKIYNSILEGDQPTW